MCFGGRISTNSVPLSTSAFASHDVSENSRFLGIVLESIEGLLNKRKEVKVCSACGVNSHSS